MPIVSNWAGTISYNASQVKRPGQLRDVRAEILAGLAANRKMRALGSRFSFSFSIKEPDIVFDLSELNDLRVFTREAAATAPLQAGAFSDPRVAGYAYAGAGVIIDEACRGLKEHGLAPFTLGGSSGQTIIGAAMTSTHGGDFDEFPLPEYVVGLHLLTGGDKDVWIERRLAGGAYTSDADVAELTDVSPANLTIFRDDELFDAVIVSLGCAGVVVGVLIKARKSTVLNERMLSRVPWSTVKAALENGSAFATLPGELDAGPGGTYRYLEVILNPYMSPAEAFVVGRNELPAGTPTSPWEPRKPPDMGRFALDFGLNVSSSSAAFTTLIDGTRLTGRANGRWQYFAYADLINVGVPAFVPVYSYELCWPADHVGSNGQLSYLWLMDRCIELVSQGLGRAQAFTGTITLRFCRGTSAHLGMQYSADPGARRFAHVEISPLQSFSQQNHELEPANQRFIDAVMASPPAQSARLHWGQGSRPSKRHDARRSLMHSTWQARLRELLGPRAGAFTNEFCERVHASF